MVQAQASREAPAYAAHAQVQAPVAATSREDPSASGTRVDVRDRSSALEGLDEVVAHVPGARVASMGGFGGFSAVALRGAGTEHTTVLFGDLPLNTADTGPFDLSLVPLSLLDSVEIYRGGAPVWWSDGAIGGVVRLVPREAEHSFLRGQTGYGSFGQAELGLSSSVHHDAGTHPAFFSNVRIARADNDYSYVDDKGTLFDTTRAAAKADDVTRRQENADILEADGLAHAGVDLLGGRLDAVLLGHERSEGVPGPLGAPTYHLRRHLVRGLSALSFTKERLLQDGERSYRVQALGSVTHQNNRSSDLEGELGLGAPVASDDDWNGVNGRLAASLAVAPFLEPQVVATLARDAYHPRDALAFGRSSQPSRRVSEALAFEARLHGQLGGTRLELRPSVRGQWSETSIWEDNLAAPSLRRERSQVLGTYRVAALVAPWQPVAFSASASTGARLPSILELFGDRAFRQANPRLQPERARAFDASVVLESGRGVVRGSAELRGFALYIDDMISYRRTSQFTVEPENISTARIHGAELGTQASYGRHWSLAGQVTALQTHNQFDKRLALRSPLQFSLRPELVIFPKLADRASIFLEAEHVSFVYLDDANLTFLPARTVFSAGGALQFFEQHMTLAARVRNLFDVRAQDLLSRPLPGFQFLLSLAVEEAVP